MTEQRKPSFWSKTWAADTIRYYMPSREALAKNRYLAPIAHRFLSPELWRFTRTSVPRGVALGLFSAFIIPLGQIFLAAFLALPLRANVPVAALVTFVTNPFTLPVWLVVANWVGGLFIQIDPAAAAQLDTGVWAWLTSFFEMAGTTVLGFFVLAVAASGIGYVSASALWRVFVARKRAKRLAAMTDGSTVR
ncbi:MAG: DUF2062 domain-containing protein [Pseudomonadota bacterium]